jgi:uncharacterized protein
MMHVALSSIAVLLALPVGILGGVTAAVSGFGIGSLLTPYLAARLGTPTAIVAVSIPHAIATAVRCWRLRSAIDVSVLRRFGLASAAGGLVGALAFSQAGNRTLTLVLAGLLIATGLAALTRWNVNLKPRGIRAQLLGAVSGFFGGVAGNQGGLRASAMLGFALSPTAFVATSTAVGLMVDAARTPIYVVRAGSQIMNAGPFVVSATVGVLIGTVLGERVLLGLSPERFRKYVGGLIFALGIWLVYGGLRS